jgi:hypothetical protein
LKIFISWSGPRSEALAVALREWFPLVLHYVDPWLSKSDIQAGERWNVEIAKELEACNFGVICLTTENVGAPWILFEAGALAKSMQDGRVIPLLLDLDVKDISGPLAQFQTKKADQGGIRELAMSLNKTASAPVPEGQVDKLFSALWADFEKQINAIPKTGAPTRHTRPQGEILEELVSSIRNVEMRFRDMTEGDSSKSRRRGMRFHPMMLRELGEMIGDDPNDPIQLLLLGSLFREEAPWMFELASETYRSIRSGNATEAEKARLRFSRTLELMVHGPIGEMIGLDRHFLRYMQESMSQMPPDFEFRVRPRRMDVSKLKSAVPDGKKE